MPGQIFAFGRFQLDAGSRRLCRDGKAVAVTVKAFDILAALVEDAGRVVDKDELMRRVWPDAIVEEANLSQQIFLLRKALGEDPKDHRFIATVPRRGYRFIAGVTQVRVPEVAQPGATDGRGHPSVGIAGPPLRLSLPLSPGPPLALGPSRPFALSPDGEQLLFTEYNPNSGAGVWVCSPSSGTAPRPLIRSRGNAFAPACSPDGRWFAYASDESGQLEVYVAAFAEAAGRVQISVDGGSEPVWSRDGRRLYFRNQSRLFATKMDDAGRPGGSPPNCVAEGPFQAGTMTGLPNYDVAGDGRLLLISQSAAIAQPDCLSVTVRWFADIRDRLA